VALARIAGSARAAVELPRRADVQDHELRLAEPGGHFLERDVRQRMTSASSSFNNPGRSRETR